MYSKLSAFKQLHKCTFITLSLLSFVAAPKGFAQTGPVTGIKYLGEGFNSVQRKTTGMVVDFNNLKDVEEFDEASVEADISVISETSKLRRLFKNKLRLRADYNNLASISASKKAKEKLSFNKNSVYVVATVSVTNKEFRIKDKKLRVNSEVKERLKEDNLDNLFAKTGDRWISTVTTGGELFIVFQYDFESKKIKKQNESFIKASFNGGSVTVAGAVASQNELKKLKSRKAALIHVEMFGLADMPSELSTDSVVAFALEFPDRIASKPIGTVMSYSTKSYEELSGAISKKDFGRFEIQRDRINELNDFISLYETLIEQHEDIKDNDIYEVDDIATANGYVAANKVSLTAIEKELETCIDDYKKCGNTDWGATISGQSFHPTEKNSTADLPARPKTIVKRWYPQDNRKPLKLNVPEDKWNYQLEIRGYFKRDGHSTCELWYTRPSFYTTKIKITPKKHGKGWAEAALLYDGRPIPVPNGAKIEVSNVNKNFESCKRTLEVHLTPITKR